MRLVHDVLQSELFFSLNLMTDTLQDMIDNMFRDYLVARNSAQVEAHTGCTVNNAPDVQAAQRRAFAVGESFGTTVYPKQTLAPGQHFDLPGAYVLGMSEFMGAATAEPPAWIVP